MSVIAKSLNQYQVEIKASNHVIIADEPVSAGGDDSGPNPYDLLLSALASCKIITVQMYAKRKNWPLTGVELTMEHHKTHASDCEDCISDAGATVDIIDTKIRFSGDLDEDQINRLKAISEKCPVHRTLSSETKIRTVLEQ